MDGHELEILSEDPARADITAAIDDDEIHLTFDETAYVVGVSR
jgi:hypothetical protein